jgi:3-hydroxybutyryl-CoA dehydratase
MIAAGDLIPERQILVRAESMPVWAAALRDPNPIHVDARATRAAGLGDRVINQGPANIGYTINALTVAFPSAAIETMDFRFLDNVRAGDIAVACGTVTSAALADGLYRATCDLLLSVEGEPVLSGTVSFTMPEDR